MSVSSRPRKRNAFALFAVPSAHTRRRAHARRTRAMTVHHVICLFEESAEDAAARIQKGIVEEEYQDMVQSAFRRCEEDIQENLLHGEVDRWRLYRLGDETGQAVIHMHLRTCNGRLSPDFRPKHIAILDFEDEEALRLKSWGVILIHEAEGFSYMGDRYA